MMQFDFCYHASSHGLVVMTMMAMATVVMVMVMMGRCSVKPLRLVKDPWLALVVGANCFLPEFCAGFGKYLVCYRIEKARLG